MNLPLDLLSLPVDEAAARLYAAGLELPGRILPRRAWLEVAQALQVKRIAEIVRLRLLAARTTKDISRILTLARKAKKPRRSARGRAGHAPGRRDQQAQAEERWDRQQPDWYDAYGMFYDEIWDEIAPIDFYYEWLSEQKGLLSARLRRPGIAACSPIQEDLVRLAEARQQAASAHYQDIRSWLDDGQAARLQELSPLAPAEQFSAAEQAMLRQYGPPGWEAGCRVEGSPPLEGEVTTAHGLAAAALLQEKGCRLQVAHHWPQITSHLLELLARPAGPDAGVLLRGFSAWAALAPEAEVRQLGRQAASLHADWLPALCFLWQRKDELFGWICANKAHIFPSIKSISVDGLIAAAYGSTLALHNLRQGYADLLAEGFQVEQPDRKWAWWGLLASGAGSLHSMAYPSFTLTCRPGPHLVNLAALADLAALARGVENIRGFIAQLDQAGLSRWLALARNELNPPAAPAAGQPIPPGILAQASESVLKYALAYLVLKTDLLKAEFEKGPFRLRRRHIRRFWNDVSQGKWGGQPLALEWRALSGSLSPDLVCEALVQALLDHLHEPWQDAGGAPLSLKQELIFILRLVAMTFAYQPPWLPQAEQVQEDDLAHAGELANFLLRCSVHAPLEMLQALGIPQAQGLPLLNGGQVTPFERRLRQALRLVTGKMPGSASNDPQAAAAVFTCRPISKLAALHRGELGGDCSTSSVPFRALSPHHTYYGIFSGEKQRRGYMTVFEAWAQTDSGRRFPVLCLETINAPIEEFDFAQQDLLLIFDAIARSRGLFPRVVLITGIGTWNYHNGEALRQGRRFRQGAPVSLAPADPVSWELYSQLSADSYNYNSFSSSGRGDFRLLAAWQPDADLVQPENLAESQRLAQLPPHRPVVTVRVNGRVEGFISEME